MSEPTGVALELPFPPSVNAYYRNLNGRTLLCRAGRVYKGIVAVYALNAPPPLDGPVAVRLDLYRPRRAGDLDNRIKPVLDALNGHAWVDDRQIVELHVYRHDDRQRPRVEVRVWPAAQPTGGAGVLPT